MAKREMKTQNIEETKVEQVVPEEQTEPIVEEQSEPVVKEAKVEKKNEGSVSKGKVVECSKLNIRKAPKKDAAVAAIVDAGEILSIIDEDKATGEWYKVVTNKKIEGFCMKKYIKIN